MADRSLFLAVNKLVNILQWGGVLLWELKDDLESMKEELRSMGAFLQDAERRQESDQIGVKVWVSQVRELAYDVEDFVDSLTPHIVAGGGGRRRRGPWVDIPAIAFFYVKTSVPRIFLAMELKVLKTRAVEVKARSERYNFRTDATGTQNQSEEEDDREKLMGPETELVGLDGIRKKLVNWLLNGSRQLCVLSIVGMGGLGKTTLAKSIYENNIVHESFKKKAWVTVSQSFSIKKFLKETLKKLRPTLKEADEEMDDIQALVRTLKSIIEEERYLIVLDDVWNLSHWECIRNVLVENSCSSRVIVTTRIKSIGIRCTTQLEASGHVYEHSALSPENAWLLFCRTAFQGEEPRFRCPEELEEVSRGFLQKCKGLPLTIKVIGGFFGHKNKVRSQWQIELDCLNEDLVGNEPEENIKKILNLSYKNLPYHQKSSFLYLSIFPEDYEIKGSHVVKLWSAEGLLKEKRGKSIEDVGMEYLQDFMNRNIIQATLDPLGTGTIKSFRLHDIFYEILVMRSTDENLLTFLHDSTSHAKMRRIAITRDISDERSYARLDNKDFSHVRSVVNFVRYFDDNGPFDYLKSKYTLPPSMRLLRVLELTRCHLSKVPSQIKQLHHLKYLSLRYNSITKFPIWFCTMQNLETLDLRGNVFNDTIAMPQLRHLLVNVPYTGHVKIKDLTSLLTLKNVNASYMGEGMSELEKLEKLRHLALIGVEPAQAGHICNALNKLVSLRWCKIETTNVRADLSLHSVVYPPRNLEKLQLQGALLNGMPQWISSHQSIRHLKLHFSELRHDPFQTLHNLRFLVELLLMRNAYLGESLCCDDAQGFPKLKSLVVEWLVPLKEVRIKPGAMPCLQKLSFNCCPNLKEDPFGLEHLEKVDDLAPVRLYVRKQGQEPGFQHTQSTRPFYERCLGSQVAFRWVDPLTKFFRMCCNFF